MAENQNTEWKESWRDEYLAWICGFANAQGGSLYVGIDDRGHVVGLPNSHKLMEDIPNKIRNSMGIVADVSLSVQDEKEYIRVDIPAYPIPISYNGSYYYRSGATNQRLTGPELESFILRRHGATWDSMPLPGFTADDIDDGVVKRFQKWASRKGRLNEASLNEPKETLMERLHLVSNGYYTNAAMLLFSDDPERWQLGAYTKLGFFETDADLLYQDEIHGSLLDQIDRIIEVLHLKYMKAAITYEGVQRIERYFVPDDALREALLNALCHKNYASGIPIQVSVYADRLYIGNPGRLPENMSKEKLMEKHTSEPYNPKIANVFYLAGFIESWGRGVEKICNACIEDGTPLPEYEIIGNSIMIRFTAREDRVIRLSGDDPNHDANDANHDANDANLTQNERKVLSAVRDNGTLSATKLAEQLGISRASVQRALKSLTEKGYLQRQGTTRGMWIVLK